MGIEEKRKHKRIAASFDLLYAVRSPFPVRIRIGNRECSAIAQDIGEGGMALLTNLEIPVDTLLSLKFTITNEAVLGAEDRTHNFELDAQVRYCRPALKINYQLGVSFLNILPQECSFISDYIKINSLIHNPQA